MLVMIQSKKDLEFYIAADRIMNDFPANKSFIDSCKEIFALGGGKVLIIKYLRHLRRYAYFYNNHKRLFSWNSIMMLWERFFLNKLGVRLGFSIGTNSLGYGVVIPHYGTIVINEQACIGNFAVLHTCTCVAGGDKKIGDGFYLSTGCQVVGSVTIGDGVTVAAHSLVNKSFEGNVLIAGTPAVQKRTEQPVWYESERDKERFADRINSIKKLKKIIYG